MNWTLVNWATNEYHALQDTLRASADRHGIGGIYRRDADQPSWESVTIAKAQFVRDMCGVVNGPVVWVDSDAEVLVYPGFFDTTQADVALTRFTGHGKVEWLAGTMYYANNKNSNAFLDEWIRCMAEDNVQGNLVEQNALRMTVDRMCREIRIHELPFSYTAIKNKWKEKHPPHIMHYQASRQIRRKYP